MTNFWHQLRQGLTDARAAEARSLDEKKTKKALRLNPDAEFLVCTANGKREMESLAAHGWEVTGESNLAPAGGTSIVTRYTMRKRVAKVAKSTT